MSIATVMQWWRRLVNAYEVRQVLYKLQVKLHDRPWAPWVWGATIKARFFLLPAAYYWLIKLLI